MRILNIMTKKKSNEFVTRIRIESEEYYRDGDTYVNNNYYDDYYYSPYSYRLRRFHNCYGGYDPFYDNWYFRVGVSVWAGDILIMDLGLVTGIIIMVGTTLVLLPRILPFLLWALGHYGHYDGYYGGYYGHGYNNARYRLYPIVLSLTRSGSFQTFFGL
jgi:hypothetical protein